MMLQSSYPTVSNQVGTPVLMNPHFATDILSEDRQCTMIIHTIGGQDTYTWRKFWEVAVAVTGMCARTDRKGVRAGLGQSIASDLSHRAIF